MLATDEFLSWFIALMIVRLLYYCQENSRMSCL